MTDDRALRRAPARAHPDAPVRPVALVTGAAKRIGRAIAEELAGDHDLVLHARTSTAEAEGLAEELAARHACKAWVVTADLTDPAAAEGLVAAARAHPDAAGRPVTVLVNNASAFPETRLEDATWADLDAMVRLHAWAPLAATRALAAQPEVATLPACVVNLLDTRITGYDPQHVPYLLSKQLLAEVTRLTAHALAPVRVNAVAPGPILPPSSKQGAAADEELERGARAVPLKRAGTAAEVAAAVRSLVDNRYVTGQTLFVDGGRHLKG